MASSSAMAAPLRATAIALKPASPLSRRRTLNGSGLRSSFGGRRLEVSAFKRHGDDSSPLRLTDIRCSVGAEEPRAAPWKRVALSALAAAAVVLGDVHLLAGDGAAVAADALKTSTCLFKSCRTELLKCLGDVKCAANIACLQSCNGRPDEIECQIKCGDLLANGVVDEFNACAITKAQCVPQKPDECLYPEPAASALVTAFDVSKLDGDWFISAGLNPAFDTFDCQRHTFEPTGPAAFHVLIRWRIQTPDGGFFTRSTEQDFVQQANPAVLLNHDNEYLHYKDDWFVLSSKMDGSPDDYFYVYYRGSNDAWDGYGGAVVYTRSPTLPQSILPELQAASRSVGLDFSAFTLTDNSCPPPEPLIARLEEKVVEAGRTELQLLDRLRTGLLREFVKDEENYLRGLGAEERRLFERMESMQMGDPEDVEDLFSNPLPLRRGRS